MTCFFPLDAYQTVSGSIVFSDVGHDCRPLKLPCGQCIGCRLDRSRQWAMRCVHEASLHDDNCFITLTYNDENIPFDASLRHRDYQLFMKRLRFKYSKKKFLSISVVNMVTEIIGHTIMQFSLALTSTIGFIFSIPHQVSLFLRHQLLRKYGDSDSLQLELLPLNQRLI